MIKGTPMTDTKRPPTALMLQWLHLLELKPGSSRQRSRSGYLCMQRGWTEWNYRDRQGEEMTQVEAEKRYGFKYWEHVRIHGERLTDAGLAVLDQHWPDRWQLRAVK